MRSSFLTTPQRLPARIVLACLWLLLAALPAGAQQAAQAPVRVTFEARMTQEGPAVQSGIEWRVFGTQVGDDGRLPQLAMAQGGIQAFDMTPGEYFVHAAYGFAGAVRRITVSPTSSREVFTLDAGALELNGVTGEDTSIPAKYLRFDIYGKQADERGERQLIARNIRPGEIVPFHAGTYHVVSQYGRLNAEVRADLRVEPGKVTQATIQHRAARMVFRLVRAAGGDALANTAWSITNESGDLITESSSAFPAFVLSEGKYTAIAKNSDKIYSREFDVIAGVDQDIEVLAN
ncbi:MAG: hypothetical protein LJE67_11080 [Salaquimonas sp.]|nr:hypothetical protein [Salaquimonas sp.]